MRAWLSPVGQRIEESRHPAQSTGRDDGRDHEGACYQRHQEDHRIEQRDPHQQTESTARDPRPHRLCLLATRLPERPERLLEPLLLHTVLSQVLPAERILASHPDVQRLAAKRMQRRGRISRGFLRCRPIG